MKRNIKFISIFCLVVLMITTFALMAFAENGATVLNNESFTNGLGVANAQNAGGHGQSRAEVRLGADGGKYGVFYPTLTGTNPGHSFLEVNYADVYLGVNDDVRYFILEFDVATESQYVNLMEFEFIGKNTEGNSVFGKTKPSIKKNTEGEWTINAVNSYKMEQERGVWQHLTFIVDVVRNDANGVGSVGSMLYTYHNGNFVGAGQLSQNDFVYLHSMRISYLNGKPVDSSDIFCIDNIKATKISDSYSGNLSSVLSDSAKSLKDFDLSNYKEGYVFPKTAPIAKIGENKYSSVSEIEEALTVGDELILLGNVYDTLNIPCECSIYNPDGYIFNYNAGEYTAYEGESTISFIEPFDSIEVIWHLGDKTEKVVYNAPSVATPPAFSGTFEMGGLVYKAIGFSKNEGGEVVADLGYVSPYNKEFWLVYDAPTAYVLHAGGTKTYAYGDGELEGLIRNTVNGDTVNLLCDATVSAAFSVNGKAITVDLGGYTLTMDEKSAGDMFTVGSGGDLTVKNGTIDAYRNGRIPTGSTSIVRRRLFVTSAVNSSFTANSLTINASKMIAIVKDGTATFDSCEIDFTNDYENMIDLYSNNDNSKPTTLNLKNCNIDAYKTVVNVFKPSSVTNNNAVINSENCRITTVERIFATEAAGSVTVRGGEYKCQYLFGKLNTNPDAVAYISEGTRLAFSRLDEKGALNLELDGCAVARTNDPVYPYTVTKDHATIKWVWPNATEREVWKVGELPTCPFEIPENTREIRYNLADIVPVTDSVDYILTTSQNFKTKMSLELGMDYSLNFYVSEIDFNYVKIGDFSYGEGDAKLVTVDGAPYYKFNTGALTAEECTKTLSATVAVPSAFGEKTYNFNLNVAKYLDEILSGGYGYRAYNLALSALAVIDYGVPEESVSVYYENIVKKYNTDAILTAIADTDSGIGNISSAIKSAYVTDEGRIAYRLELNSEFSGNMIVTYTLGGKEFNNTVTVKSGKYNGKEYVDFYTDAAEFNKGIKITVGNNTGSVDVAYCSKQEKGIVEDRLVALYSYSKQAEKYLSESEDK